MAWYDPLFAPVVGYDWGGTDYLEEHRLAHEKYIERLNRWAASPAFPHWEMQERDAAIADANYVYSITDSAAGYWGSLPAFWSSYAGKFISIDPVQFRKITDSVGMSSEAADTYAENRKLSTYIEPPEIGKNIPWWIYAIGGLVVFNAVRR